MSSAIANEVPCTGNRDDLISFSISRKQDIEEVGATGRSRIRRKLEEMGYNQDQIEIVAPMKLHREKREMPKRCFDCIKRSLGVSGELPTDRGFWNPERVRTAAVSIATEYDGHIDSAVCNLTKLRTFLSGCGLTKSEYMNSYMPELTAERRRLRGYTTNARGMEGITAPDQFFRIADLRERVEGYLGDIDPEITGQMVADLMVALCARPGEIYTLRTTDDGVSGVLKKGSCFGDSFPLVSAIGKDLASEFLDFWNEVPLYVKIRAEEELDDLVAEWGIEKRDLRAIGCNLAMRDSNIRNPTTMYSSKMAGVSALRHKDPIKVSFDHYSRVIDPYISLASEIAELDNDTRNSIMSMVKERKKKYRFSMNDDDLYS